jgi:hypothetical protein
LRHHQLGPALAAAVEDRSMKHYCDRCKQCRACEAMSAADELDTIREKHYIRTSTDFGHDDHSGTCVYYIGEGGHVYVLDYFETPTEKPMTYEEAMMITRHGRRFGVFNTPARQKLYNEALDLLKKRAEELYQAADKKAEAARTLVDVHAYADNSPFPHMNSNPWLREQFSDGTVRKTQNAAAYEIARAFQAGVNAARMPRDEDYV